ncbi:MAG: class I SAM-dependent methyltransferase [Dokdonella sp.]
MATLDWDYSALAEHYRQRAPYAPSALHELFATIGLPARSACIDIGAGTGRLTASLLAEGLQVTAIEPNAAMRAIGSDECPQAHWLPTRGEATGLPDRCCRLVTFGSSFNVLAADAALRESARLLRPGGWLVCLWNHRDLDDPLQAQLQAVIGGRVAGYDHGRRRDDPTPQLLAGNLFGDIVPLCGSVLHTLSCADFVDGFRAHATLIRQAGSALPDVLEALAAVLHDRTHITVPFITRIYAARLKHRA